ncbi:MAG: hypothetical protein J6T01_01855 [Kiritimatiellae bacterium]|nr:hypothetical protein [Kiritimatiellia bacterium]
MIVKMKHLDIVCIAAGREEALERLRSLGAVHLDLGGAAGAGVARARGEIEAAERAVHMIRSARAEYAKISGAKEKPETRMRKVGEVLELAADRAELLSAVEALDREIKEFDPYGDFDPALAKKLIDRGVDFGEALPARLPEMRLSAMRERRESLLNRANVAAAKMACTDENAVLAKHPELRERMEFEQARELMTERGAVCAVSGWLPAPEAESFKAAAREAGWGFLLREPADGETPPTLIEPPKPFMPMKALFRGLGIAPAYTESDVSVPFMCYFSLFFAMLVGDGGYGAIFLAATLALRRKLPRSWFVLLTVFSFSTIAWGFVSDTWFGAHLFLKAQETRELVPRWPWAGALVGPALWLGDVSYHNMMLLCFTIGVSHLMLARVWNGVCRLPDSTAVAEFGWAGVLLFMYLVTNFIVGIFTGIPQWAYWVFGASLVCVFGFTVKPSQLKTRGAELGMLPLNIMSALGDIISYVRLFAVGLASVKVAENFNAMATGLVAGADAVWFKALMSVAMVAVLVVGHGLNLAMAALSILVHAVRLNTLEFSNHKGVSWAGYAFRPFKRSI